MFTTDIQMLESTINYIYRYIYKNMRHLRQHLFHKTKQHELVGGGIKWLELPSHSGKVTGSTPVTLCAVT